MWKEAKDNKFGKMGSSDMMDKDVFSLFPGEWLTDMASTIWGCGESMILLFFSFWLSSSTYVCVAIISIGHTYIS